MVLAIAESERVRGTTSPNPPVGCVILDEHGKAVGFDLTTDTTLWPLVESARDSGEIRVSPTLPLVNLQSSGSGSGCGISAGEPGSAPPS